MRTKRTGGFINEATIAQPSSPEQLRSPLSSERGVGVSVGAAAADATPNAWPVPSASTAPSLKNVIRAQTVAKPATLHTTSGIVNGKSETILVNAKGFPLYYYQADTAKKSFVSGELARLWPPLLSAKPTGTGTKGKLNRVEGGERAPGHLQRALPLLVH